MDTSAAATQSAAPTESVGASAALEYSISRSVMSRDGVFHAAVSTGENISIRPEVLTPAGEAIVALAKLPQRARDSWFLSKLSPQHRVGRVLYFRRCAMESESEGKWSRADFFWNQSLSLLGAIFSDMRIWQSVLSSMAQAQASLREMAPPDFRDVLVRELFWDTFCGLYNGYLQQNPEPKPDSRAFVHVVYLLRTQRLSPTRLGLPMTTALPGIRAQIAAARTIGTPDEALKLAKKATKGFPDQAELWDLRLEVSHSRIFRKLSKGESERDRRADMVLLTKVLTEIEQLLQENPYCSDAYDAIANVRHIRSIRRAESSLIADALSDNRAVLIYNPQHEHAAENRTQLVKLFQSMQQQLAKVLLEIAGKPNTRLTPSGQKTQAQINRAATLLKSSDMTADEHKIVAARELAMVRGVWLRAGLKAPKDRWDERATALYRALVEIMNASPKDVDAIRVAWNNAASPSPLLTDIDLASVTGFLGKLLKLPHPAVADGEPVVRSVRPVIKSLPAKASTAAAPFSFWLFTTDDLRLKLQVACALLLVVSTASVFSIDSHRAAARGRIFERLAAAAAAGQSLDVIDAAESYFSASAPLGGDPSEPEARRLYLDALKRRLASHAGVPDVEADEHLRRFTQLSGNRT
jgi:hypothetical protein